MKVNLQPILGNLGYRCIIENSAEGKQVYGRWNQQGIQLILCLNHRKELFIDQEHLQQIQKQAEYTVLRSWQNQNPGDMVPVPQLLTILISEDLEGAAALCRKNSGIWVVDGSERRLLIYENQPGDYFGLKVSLENYLDNLESKPPVVFTKASIKNWLNLNLVVIIVNIVIWLGLSVLGDTKSGSFMLNYGAMYPDYIVKNGQWWRLFTSMFLHFGAEHLLNNMFMLFFLGKFLIDAVGNTKYLIVYIGAGLGGNLLSLYMNIRNGEAVVSAGASGAIFGVIGGLIWILLSHKGKFQNLNIAGVVIMAVLCISYGFSTVGVDNSAHLGGLICGFVIAMMESIISGAFRCHKIRKAG